MSSSSLSTTVFVDHSFHEIAYLDIHTVPVVLPLLAAVLLSLYFLYSSVCCCFPPVIEGFKNNYFVGQ